MDIVRPLFFLPDAVFAIDPKTAAIIDANKRACSDMRASLTELTQMTVLQVQDDVSDLNHWHALVESMRAQPNYLFIGHHRRPDGSVYPVEVNSTLIAIGDEELLISVARDISSRVEHMNRVSGESDSWHGLHDIADGVWEWDIGSQSLYFSPSLKRLLGYGPDEMRPCLETWKDNIHPEDAPLVLSMLDEHLKGLRHLFEAEYRLRNRNGHYLWIRDRGQVRERSDEGLPLRAVGMVNNITDLKLVEQELQQQADYDELTGLFNRRRGEVLAEQQLALMQRQRRNLGLCLIDVDDFKQINDVYGHLAGDQVLRRLAEYISNFVRRSDLLFRWGGEEFVLVCPDTDASGMRELINKLCRGIECLSIDGELAGRSITVSAGIAVFPGHATDLINLTARADSALYSAKRQGKNRVILFDYELEGLVCSVGGIR
ncbi:sensor domain-containing diguanylate cyclase [Marinobacterium sediminicola]|uniref:PAS domain S-box-containing protein/diguanylate cyclase (GGDEF) domain-containing protein n=1 Tax=Marinobacterium sediminicola TaxID=518898 RepID=A0ABY1RVZ4_9GAMM|nr:diguanylate cyclase [Marinobacterium sediminicola]ULG70489.1 diguanylate cyclase [Marinobacterium sediminicola]SMR69193.1 PAS domain S-box-containing protein/diguanylate cyclase (GGDEF) domain-containing protein [Marinobacterium sediminicola]